MANNYRQAIGRQTARSPYHQTGPRHGVITDREWKRIRYHARDVLDAWAMTTLANCRTSRKTAWYQGRS
jgi:hypothetical protein